MKYETKFKRQLLAGSIAMVVAASANSQEEVLEAPDDNIEEVVVTGIRASLQRSMDIKRDAKGIVDGISAEDIGKFPDTNLAESLQRITGVAIERDRGEGSKITVRGFGPDFNIVVLMAVKCLLMVVDPLILAILHLRVYLRLRCISQVGPM
jgi:outer membrane receptor for ferrienterochelin and colicin